MALPNAIITALRTKLKDRKSFRIVVKGKADNESYVDFTFKHSGGAWNVIDGDDKEDIGSSIDDVIAHCNGALKGVSAKVRVLLYGANTQDKLADTTAVLNGGPGDLQNVAAEAMETAVKMMERANQGYHNLCNLQRDVIKDLTTSVVSLGTENKELVKDLAGTMAAVTVQSTDLEAAEEAADVTEAVVDKLVDAVLQKFGGVPGTGTSGGK